MLMSGSAMTMTAEVSSVSVANALFIYCFPSVRVRLACNVQPGQPGTDTVAATLSPVLGSSNLPSFVLMTSVSVSVFLLIPVCSPAAVLHSALWAAQPLLIESPDQTPLAGLYETGDSPGWGIHVGICANSPTIANLILIIAVEQSDQPCRSRVSLLCCVPKPALQTAMACQTLPQPMCNVDRSCRPTTSSRQLLVGRAAHSLLWLCLGLHLSQSLLKGRALLLISIQIH